MSNPVGAALSVPLCQCLSSGNAIGVAPLNGRIGLLVVIEPIEFAWFTNPNLPLQNAGTGWKEFGNGVLRKLVRAQDTPPGPPRVAKYCQEPIKLTIDILEPRNLQTLPSSTTIRECVQPGERDSFMFHPERDTFEVLPRFMGPR
jgi:hypothetical protein